MNDRISDERITAIEDMRFKNVMVSPHPARSDLVMELMKALKAERAHAVELEKLLNKS
jgi:predicted phosphatase